ncbi:MAG: aryl-sulfate sulfotransferase [Nannocystaceae bacterium]
MNRVMLDWRLLPLPLILACGQPDVAPPENIVAQLSTDIVTVVHVTWTTSEPSVGYVQFGRTEDMDGRTPLEAEPRTNHSATLLGLTSDTQIHYRVVTWDGEDAAASGRGTLRTGKLPLALPTIVKTGTGHDSYTIVPLLGATTAVAILDGEGRYVWYRSDDRDLDIYRARISRDGNSILYNAASVSGDLADNSEIVRVPLDGSQVTSTPVPLLAHDFVELPDGTLGAIAVEYRDFEGAPLRGDKIIEVAADGTQTVIWTSWDCFDPTVDQGDDMISHGWTFANALDYDPQDQAYYIGMRNFSSIAKIDRATGACLWVLGSTAATITFDDAAPRFLHQHQFEVRGDRILIFDNDGSPAMESRVLEYSLDLQNGVANHVWSYLSDPTVFSFVLGEPTRLDNGDTLINWSAAGQIERVTPDGESRWKINTPAGYAFGFHTLAKTMYPRPTPN